MWQYICSLIVEEWHVRYNTIMWRHVANSQMVQQANYPMGQRSDGPTVQWANRQRTQGSHIANRWRSDHEICTHHRVICGRAAGRLNLWLVQPAYVGVRFDEHHTKSLPKNAERSPLIVSDSGHNCPQSHLWKRPPGMFPQTLLHFNISWPIQLKNWLDHQRGICWERPQPSFVGLTLCK